MTVSWIFRKSQSYYFSIEKVFLLIEEQLKQDPVEIRRVYMPNHRLSITTIFRNIRFAQKQRSDLYHVTGDVHYVVLGLPTRKTILTIHDCVFMYQASGIKRMLLYYLFLKWPVKKSAVITTVSEKSRQDIIQFTKCAPGKVVVIPDPFDQRFTHRPYEFNQLCPTILFIGITPNKNLFRVIDALEGIKCRLHIIGRIPSAEKAQLLQKGIDFQESYELNDAKLREVYITSDILLFPSLFEGFGLPIVEAQQTGRPVITSALSPMKEVAGEGACLVNPLSVQSIRDGINKVIHDKIYREDLIAKGLTNAKKYNPETIANRYLTLYKNMRSV